MANAFDRFDSAVAETAVPSNPFDAFDSEPVNTPVAGLQSVQPAQEEVPALNMVRGAVERGGQLLGGLFTAGNAAAEKADESYPLGGLVWEGGLLPDYKGPEEYAKWRSEQGGQEPLKTAANYWNNTDVGYEENHTWERVKQEFSEGGALSGSAWAEVMAYGAEQGVKSIPDMVAAVAALPAYITARSGEIGTERAKNKGKSETELVDVLEAAPAAIGSALLERIGAKGISEAGAEALGKEALKAGIGKMVREGAKAGGKEAATEFMQEGIIEYLGERLGTGADLSLAEAVDRGAAGAVAGGVYGTGAGTAGAAYNAARNRSQAQSDQVDSAPPILQDQIDQEAAQPQPTDDNAPVQDYEGRPEWANDRTNIFRDGVEPEPVAAPEPTAEAAPAGNPFDAFDEAPVQPEAQPQPGPATETPAETGQAAEARRQMEAAPVTEQVAAEPRGVSAEQFLDEADTPEVAAPISARETEQAEAVTATTELAPETDAIQPVQPPPEPAPESAPQAQLEAPADVVVSGSGPALSGKNESKKAPHITLEPSSEKDQEIYGSRPPNSKGFVYSIHKDGEDIGYLDISLFDDGTARVEDIVSADGAGSLGAREVRGIMRQIIDKHPSIKRFTGERISGARRGGQYDLSEAGVETSISVRGRKSTKNQQTQPEAEQEISVEAADEAVPKPSDQIEQAAAETNTNPTDAQKEAGNYRKAKVRIQGLEIAIENPKGSTRSGTDADGNQWESTMTHHYGDIKRTTAADGDNLDVFIGPDPDIDQVFVIDQPNADGTFDEHKVMLGFKSEKAAKEGYLANYEKGWKVGPITRMSMDEFKAWMREGDTTKPVKREEAKPAKKAEPAAAPPTQPIEDFGEKIEGARKDYASKLKDAKERDVSTVPLSKSWPEPNYQKMLDEGVPAETVALVRALRDEVPTKPQKGWKLKGWVEMVTGLRDMASTLMENQDVASKVLEQIRAMKASNRTAREAKHILGRMDLYQEMGHENSFKGVTFEESFYQMYMGENNVTLWEVERLSKASAFGNMPRTLATGKTREEALTNLRKALGKLPESTKTGKAVRFNIYRDRYSNDVFIGKKIGKDVVRMKSFDDDIKAARKYLEENQQALEEQLEKMKRIPPHRRTSNSPRVGVDHRKGGDVTPEAFSETFGFRGVQFGNYVEQGRRQADLNEAYDALMDLAGILDIPAKALSLNGELGLAFGARGKGGKNAPMAHYEPGTIVINLTKKTGAGSLAHEWWHSLDNYFGRGSDRKPKDAFATGGQPASDVRPEMVDAFRNIRQTVNRIRMKERSRKLDKMRTKVYWSTDIEMSARAFESYVIERLKDQNASNDYLANIVSEDYWKASEALGMQDSDSYPYPEAAEVPDIRAAYDHFFQTIESRETEEGGVALFSRDGEYRMSTKLQMESLSIQEAESIRDELMQDWKGAPDVIIRNSISEFPPALQRAISEAGAQSDMRGVLWRDNVYLLASRIPDRARMEQVILHEVIGHYGLRKMLGKDMERVLNQIWISHGGKGRAKYIIDRYFPDGFDVNNKEHRHIVAEELIAHLAEQNRGQTLVQRAVAIIREGLRKLGFTLEFTVDDIVNLLRRSRQTVENGGFETADQSEWNAAPTSRTAEGTGDARTESVPSNAGRDRSPSSGLNRSDGSTNGGSSIETVDRSGEGVDAPRAEGVRGSTDDVIPPGARFSRADVPDLDPEPFGAPSDTLIRKAASKIADKFTVLKGVQQNIKERFGEIAEDADAYMAEELFHGKVENDIRLIQENMVEPLAKQMSEYDISLKQLDEFLYAMHAPERNRVIAERNPKMPDGGSGMTNAEAAAVINKAEQSGKLGQYKELAGRVHKMLERRRQILSEAGLLDEDTLGAWEASYKHYVPLKGWAADEKQDATPRSGRGFSISGKESQMAAGRSSKAASPVANAISDLSEAVLRHRKNEVGNAFLNLVQAYPNDNYWRVYTDENPEVQRKVVRRKDPATGKMVTRVEEQAVPMAMMTDRYFTTKVDGETRYIKIKDERLMNAMRNLGPDNNGLLVRALGTVTRLMSSLNTSYNPEFVISNFSRDIQTALLNLTSEQSSEDGKARGKKIAAKTLKDVPTSIRAINASLKGSTLTGKAGEWQKHFDQFRADGAKTGWFDMKDVDGQMKDLETMISMASGGVGNTARRTFKAVTDWVENTNSAIENGVRLSAYVNAIEAGIPRAQAASLAKNMTVNFNRRGELGTTMNALYMFANASVQGTANFVRTLGRLNGQKGDRMWRRLNTAQKIAVGMAVGGFALSVLNRLVAGDDDDGVNWWDKVPDYVKERNIVIMKSLVGGEPGEYWTIPLPYGYNIFPVIGTSMEHMLASDKSAGDIAGNVVLAALGSFSPIGFEESQEAYGVVAKNITPTILRPIASISLNENFMGGPIYKENFPFGTQKPDSALYFRSTPEVFKELAKGLNDVSGGSEFRSGAVDLSPDVMQFLVGYYGGGAYDFFTSRAPNAALKLAQGVELEDREVPFWRKIHGKVLPYEDQSMFYDRRNEINQLVDERDNLKGRERVEFIREYRDKIRLQSMVKSTEKRLKVLRQQRDRIETMGLSAAEEDKRLQEIERQMKRTIDQFNERYNEADD